LSDRLRCADKKRSHLPEFSIFATKVLFRRHVVPMQRYDERTLQYLRQANCVLTAPCEMGMNHIGIDPAQSSEEARRQPGLVIQHAKQLFEPSAGRKRDNRTARHRQRFLRSKYSRILRLILPQRGRLRQDERLRHWQDFVSINNDSLQAGILSGPEYFAYKLV
jgi:hypothetical protein